MKPRRDPTMYRGLPKENRRRFSEFMKKRKHWMALAIYDNSLTACVMSREDHGNEMRISAIKQDPSWGIRAGRIVNSHKAGEAMGFLLKTVSEKVGIKDHRVLIGLDSPPLRLTPKQWTDDSCLKAPCDETMYKRILHKIVRESSFDSQHILEIVPLRICVDGRLVEDPCGITGQISMDNMLISLSYQDYKDFEKCLGRIGYKCESFSSGFHNLCSAFSDCTCEGEHWLLVDLKYSSTDVIMFQGDQPVAMKCYQQGLDKIVVESLSSMLNIGRNDAITYVNRYCNGNKENDGEIIGKDELASFSVGLKRWEMHEIVMGQLKKFIFMQDGIGELLARRKRDLQATPRKLIVIGEGSRIPEIDAFLEKELKVKYETRNCSPSGADAHIPATAYGMARSIAADVGAKLRSKISF